MVNLCDFAGFLPNFLPWKVSAAEKSRVIAV